MTDKELKLAIGALLHDIGKVAYRAGDGRQHSLSGEEFLREEAGIKDSDILDMVRYHHGRELSRASLPEDSPAYIVYIADNIVSAADRRSTGEEESGFDPQISLESIFNILNGNHGKMHYRPAPLYDRGGINMPTGEEISYDQSFYSRMKAEILDALKGVSNPDPDYINSLLCVLEAYLSYLPSSTAIHERADISLYDHVKMTAAYASCISQYLEEKQETNYRELLFEKAVDFYQEKAFRLISMDISGIQKFIYTVHSEGALRALRSRSFYLEILMEHMIDQLLDAIKLTRANLIYSGGGHCYILAPNTEAVTRAVAAQQETFNDFFLKMFDVSLYVAVADVACSARELENVPSGSYSNLFRNLSTSLSAQKMHRYTPDQLIRLNNQKHGDLSRECKVCKTSSRLLADGRCEFCEWMHSFSSDILYKTFFTVVIGERKDGIPLPGGMTLLAQDEDALRKCMEEDPYFVRTYGKNAFYTGKSMATRLWIGDYTRKGTTSEEYAQKATGIRRIAVLRADVDNLGKAFVSGFEDRYTSLSRTATFSRQMSLFFKHHINDILENGSYSLSGRGPHEREAAVVYSGGDDLFIIGAWDDVIGLAIDIHDQLEEYSQGMLTISAGIGVYDAKYPLRLCAEEVAGLEDASKEYPVSQAPEKNALTVFSPDHTYSWKEWKEKVLGEKYETLSDFLERFQERGNSFLYNILELIRGMDDKINLARFAYALARLSPSPDEGKERLDQYQYFSRTMYQWVQDENDRKQLVTAILVYVYLHREKGGEEV